ncbi:response regulator [Pseudomonas sp. Fl5BN2]|nr:response regulator [Pseudomonas sp. Fl5BN2]NBF11537.1 response regulator [Pseudomonas sp. Fl4BN1]
MGGALFLGFQRIISQEQERISFDFTLLAHYMDEQEALLKRLNKEHMLEESRSRRDSSSIFHLMDQQNALGATLFQGTPSPVDTPFTLVCEDLTHCPLESESAVGFGRYLSDLYSSFWIHSNFPASPLMVVDASKGTSYTIPTVGSTQPRLPAPLVMATIAAVRANATGLQEIRWVRLRGFPEQLVAITPLHNITMKDRGDAGIAYAVTLTHRDRLNVLSRAQQDHYYDAFWLESQHDGLLLGERPQPINLDRGVNYQPQGLIFRVDDDKGTRTGYYMLSYQNLFLGHNNWLLAVSLALMLISPLAGWAYVRWFQRRVIAPAQRAHAEIVESDQFSRALLETTPVALCVLSRETSRIVFANTLTLKWFDTQVGQNLNDTGLDAPLMERIRQARAPGEIENYQSFDGRSFYIAYAPTRYRNQDVVICAFADLSVRAHMEQQLTQAKQAADKANGAKSMFLATMSHEIRTPLYGVLGSLELMGLSDLDQAQRQLLERIQVSSGLLLQIISDILDITKIESGQLSLNGQAFDPRALVQGCVASFVDRARNKDLLLFSCVDPTLPATLSGDPGRISQLLNNLISNAVKFTHSGHIIVRARAEPGCDGHVRMLLQVADTGIGIGKEEQEQLFMPFYQIDAHSHTVHGAGLGLSICAKLAKLMGSEIHLTSELGLGSSFSMSLELPLVEGVLPARQPDLAGARVYVQSPHHELTANLCQWLEKWGARTSPVEGSPLDDESRGILLNLFDSHPGKPERWDPGLTVINLGDRTDNGHKSQTDACDFYAIGLLIERTLRGEPDMLPASRVPGLQNNNLPALCLNVLIAEDNQINQATLSHQLKQLGCQTTLAVDGAEALELWQIGNYDLLLTDVNMPRMNGYELTSKLRLSGDDRPIIGVTANAMSDEEKRCRASGMDAWLVKPVQLRTLWNCLAPLSGIDLQDCSMPSARSPQPDSLPDDFRQLFVSTMTQDLEKLRLAIDEQQHERIFYLLHRIRGSLAVAGFESLIEQVDALGESLRDDGLTAATHAGSLTLINLLHSISQSD